MTKITFITADGTRHEVQAKDGATLLETAKHHDLPLQGTCGGSRICGTCHLYINMRDFDRVGAPSSDEMDVLEWVPTLRETSRLGCQIRVCPELEGIEVSVPE